MENSQVENDGSSHRMSNKNDLLAVSFTVHLTLDLQVGEIVIPDLEVVVAQTPIGDR